MTRPGGRSSEHSLRHPPKGVAPLTGKLTEERDFLLGSLRDLEREHEAGELADDDYVALRDEYTVRAAAVLRQMEQAAGPAKPRSRPAPAPPRRRRSLLVTVGVVVLIAGMAGGAVAAFSGQRGAGAPITGSAPDSSQGRLAQALQLETQGKAADALKIYDDLLKTDPKNVQALAYRGWLLKRAGFPDLAMASLDQAVQIDPSYPDAHFFRGMVLYQDRKDPAAAVPEFRAFLSNDPPPEMVSLVEGQLKQAMTDAGMPTG
jgi:tetratricopeptide (TPR) repeat protein